MSNAYYAASGNPATGSEGLSALIRAEFASIQAGFDFLPVFTGNGNKAVVVNAGGTALTVTTGSMALTGNLTLAGSFTTTGAFNTTLAQGASVTLTLPVVSGTLATLAGTETLSNKTFVAPVLGTPASGDASNLTGTATGLTAGNATNATNATTATNVSGGTASVTTLAASSTVSGAGFTARFASPGPIGSTSASTGAFTTISASGQITSTQATGSAPFVVASTTNVANLNASSLSGATFASPGAIGSGTPSTGAFTTLSATSTVSGAGITALFASPPAIGGTSASTGAFTSLTASTAGTSGNQVVNFSQFNPTLSTTGHILLPGGLILNWGTGTTDGSGNATVTYNQSYSTAPYMVVASATQGGVGIASSAGSFTTFSVASFLTASNAIASTAPFNWIAIGK